MHPALQIEEILLIVFGHCHQWGQAYPGLVSTTRTCRTFKEPALDVLWGKLDCSSPLVRCLPEACYQLPYPRLQR
ncbi:hypothetical protein V8E55_009231 [Tylopilus felleus]